MAGEPGGFTRFMFRPRSPLNKGSSTESRIKDRGRIREFFDLDLDDETVKFYQKKEFFVPTNKHESHIVLQTWHDLLVLLTTVKNSIAADGLSLILEKFDKHHQVMQEMFASVENFGLTVLVILDNHLERRARNETRSLDRIRARHHQRSRSDGNRRESPTRDCTQSPVTTRRHAEEGPGSQDRS